MINKKYIIIIFLLFSGCQLSPTKVSERHISDHPLYLKLDRPIVISKEVNLLDTRAFYDYSMYHLENAHYVRWQDFLVVNNPKKLIPTQQIAKKLALKNVHPSQAQLVIGDGQNSEFAAIAWLLLSLGVSDVQTVYFSYFKNGLTTKQTPVINAKSWAAKSIGSEFTSNVSPKDLIVDVRPEAIAFKLPLLDERIKNNKIINLPWRDLYNSFGRPNLDVASKLKAIGITPNQSLVLVSSHLSESAAAAYALKVLGYKKIIILD